MKPVRSITTALLFLGLAGSAFAYPTQGNSDKDKKDKPEGKQGKASKQAKPDSQAKHEGAKHEGAKHEDQAAPQAQREQRQPRAEQQVQQRDERQQRRATQQDQRARQDRAQQAQEGQRARQDRAQQAQEGRRARQEQMQQAQRDRRTRQVEQQRVRAQEQPANRPPGWDRGKKTGWNGGSVPPGHQARLPQDRQRQLITQQQQRVIVYRQRLNQDYTNAQRYSIQLQQDRRMASYRYQQAYIARLRQQQLALRRYNANYNYNNDPYYYTAPTYRYDRGGTFYETNQYGADTLRQAINNGYDQGFQAGQAARQDRWSTRYQDSYGYQDANYGYDGRYTDQDSYNYYFRQGFERGYDDGYNSRTQYGSYSNGHGSILANILGTILNLQSMR